MALHALTAPRSPASRTRVPGRCGGGVSVCRQIGSCDPAARERERRRQRPSITPPCRALGRLCLSPHVLGIGRRCDAFILGAFQRGRGSSLLLLPRRQGRRGLQLPRFENLVTALGCSHNFSLDLVSDASCSALLCSLSVAIRAVPSEAACWYCSPKRGSGREEAPTRLGEVSE